MPWSTQLPAHSMRPRCLHTALGSSNGSITYVTHSIPSSRRRRMASPAKKPTWPATPINSPDGLSTKRRCSLLSATLPASTASSPTMVTRAVHLPRLVSTQPSTTRLLPEEQSPLRRVRQLSVTGVGPLAASLSIQSVQAGLFAFKLRSTTSMAQKVALDKAWAEAAQRCRLSPAHVRTANELGFKPRSLLTN